MLIFRLCFMSYPWKKCNFLINWIEYEEMFKFTPRPSKNKNLKNVIEKQFSFMDHVVLALSAFAWKEVFKNVEKLNFEKHRIF